MISYIIDNIVVLICIAVIVIDHFTIKNLREAEKSLEEARKMLNNLRTVDEGRTNDD